MSTFHYEGFYVTFRYDVELFQRIEHLIGKKLPLYQTTEEEVMSLVERVSEAQRCAKMELKDQIDKRKRHLETEDLPAAKRIQHKGKRKL